jgi:hypothetical protein
MQPQKPHLAIFWDINLISVGIANTIMQEFSAILGNVVTGLFTLLGGFVAWRLKRKDESTDRKTKQAIESRKELIEIYAQTFSSLEQAMKCVKEQESYELTPEKTLLNAKIRLLGSEETNLAYDEVAEKLQTWSVLYVAASPKRMKVGEQTVVILQAPDPTEKYKVPAQEAQKVLHEAFKVLRKRMQTDLNDIV